MFAHDVMLRGSDSAVAYAQLGFHHVNSGGSLPPTGLPGGIKSEEDEVVKLPVIIPASRTKSGFDFSDAGGE